MSVSPSASAHGRRAQVLGVGVEPREPLACAGPRSRPRPPRSARRRPGVAPAGVVDARRAGQAARARTRGRVSNIAKRSPSRVTRLWSTSAAMPSSASGPPTASAASSVQPPTKTPSCANSFRASVVEQVVAPADRRAQRPLARRGVARAGGQQVEPPLEPLEDRRRARAAWSARRRARSPAAARRAARRCARRTLVVGRRARAADRPRAPGARTARAPARARAAARAARARRRAAAARGSWPRASSRGDAASSSPSSRRGVDHLLEVVEHEQQLARRRGARPASRRSVVLRDLAARGRSSGRHAPARRSPPAARSARRPRTAPPRAAPARAPAASCRSRPAR